MALIEIVDLSTLDEAKHHEVATLLFESFKEHWPDAWPTHAAALEEVREALGPDRISRIALDRTEQVIGWIGGICQYRGNVWELHPLMVHAAHRGQGIGKALVADLEEQVRRRGGLILWVGTDDEDNMTSLGGIELFPHPLKHLAELRNLKGHPYGFYEKMGFVVTGVMPHANGYGKPDIFMAKRL